MHYVNRASYPLDDLWTALGDEEIKLSFGPDYRAEEREILKPALERQGFTVLGFEDGERDDFGPLSRIVICEKDGAVVGLVYG